MINLPSVINDKTFLISDTHFGHQNILQYEPVRVEYLSDYNSEVIEQCQELLELFDTVPKEDRRNHPRIIALCKELIPYHDEMLTEKWNSAVGEHDTVFHLGDFGFKDIDQYTNRLNGKKIILRGNHDMKNGRTYTDGGWKEMIESVKLNLNGTMFEMVPNTDRYWNAYLTEINGWKIMFSHYPIFNSNEWDLKKYGNITRMLEKLYADYGAEINIHGHVHSLDSEFKQAINVSVERCTSLTPMRIGELLENKGYAKK